MDAEQRQALVEAIRTIAGDGELDKKPNVADLKERVDFDFGAEERDEAWEAFTAEQESDGDADDADDTAGDSDDVEPDEDGDAVERAVAARRRTTAVTNESGSPLAIRGVVIAPGETADVPGFVKDHHVMKAWMKAGVIKTGKGKK